MSDLYTMDPDIPSAFSDSAPVQTVAASSHRRGNSDKINKNLITMPNRLTLDSLPLEVIHQIFALLPSTTLTTLRLTAHSLLSPATSNPHWRTHFYSLLPLHSALHDVAAVPLAAWSFSLAPDGWFRAYTAVVRVARNEWLWTEEQLKGTTWMVFFKAFLKEGGARGDGDGSWHALVEMRPDLTCHPLEGLPLNISSWYVDVRRSLRFSGYPPNIPSRDPYTWCRILQHVSVLMVTDAPEFLEVLVALNNSILEEATAGREEFRAERRRELEVAVEKVLEERKSGFCERLRKLHLERTGGIERRDRICAGEGSSSGAGWAADEESDWSHEEESEEGEWSDDGEYDYGLNGCALYQHFRGQPQWQHSGLPAACEDEGEGEEGES